MRISPLPRRRPGGSVTDEDRPDRPAMVGAHSKLAVTRISSYGGQELSPCNSPLKTRRSSSELCIDEETRLQNGNLLQLPEKSPLRSSLIKEGSRKPSPAGSVKSVSFSTMPTEKKISNVGDCLAYMQSGSDLIKVRGSTRRYKRRFSLDADCSHIRWTPTNKKPHKAKIVVEAIKEIRVGRNTENLRSSDSCFEDLAEDCAFSIIWADDYQCLDLIACGPDEANIWVTGLMALTSGNLPETSMAKGENETKDGTKRPTTIRDRWLQEMFQLAASRDAESLNEKEFLKLFKKLSPRLSYSKIKLKMKELESLKPEEERGRFSCAEFCDQYKDLSTRPEVYFLMVRYANKDYLDCEDLQMFLETEQGILSVTKELCQAVINRYEPSAEGQKLYVMTVDGFTNYLMSEECTLFDGTHRSVCQDMSQPFCHYFVATSHNTYLTEDQLKGPSSIDGYVRALRKGCRLMELDVWESEESLEPVIYHGHTLTSKLSISKALQAIREYAFDASAYPLILKLEQHLSTIRQRHLAEMLVNGLGEKLYKPPKNQNSATDAPRLILQSPESFKGRILLMGKRLPDGSDPEGDVSEEDESAETNRMARAPRKSASSKKVPLCRELSDLMCPFLLPTQGKDLKLQSPITQQPTEVVSLNETQCLRLAQSFPEEYSSYTRRYLTRIYPNAVRVDSSNLNPQEFWNYGVQLVALNYQTPGLMMDLQDGKFSGNGGCGYVLKPAVMRDEMGHFSPRDKLPLALNPQVLHLKVVSGQQLPRPRGSTAKGDSCDPYVVVEVFGVPSDCAEERTKTVRNDSFNPSFDESFQFQISVPELAIVRFLVLDDDYIGDDFIGQYSIPFDCLQSGYRNLTLLNNEGEPLDNSTLFVHVAITNKRGGGKPKKRGMSVKRRNQKIHTGIKMVGLKQMDELFKNAIVPMADCIQLRSYLEKAIVDWQEASGLGPASTMRQGLRLLQTRLQTAAAGSPLAVDQQPAAEQSGESAESSETGAPGMEIWIDDANLPHVEGTGQIPDLLKKSFATLTVLIQHCQAVTERTDPLLYKLEDATRRISESYDEMSALLTDAGLKGHKANRASENFAWNVRLLKGQVEQMHKTQHEAANTLQQVVDTACVIGVLREKCVQPCSHRSGTAQTHV